MNNLFLSLILNEGIVNEEERFPFLPPGYYTLWQELILHRRFIWLPYSNIREEKIINNINNEVIIIITHSGVIP